MCAGKQGTRIKGKIKDRNWTKLLNRQQFISRGNADSSFLSNPMCVHCSSGLPCPEGPSCQPDGETNSPLTLEEKMMRANTEYVAYAIVWVWNVARGPYVKGWVSACDATVRQQKFWRWGPKGGHPVIGGVPAKGLGGFQALPLILFHFLALRWEALLHHTHFHRDVLPLHVMACSQHIVDWNFQNYDTKQTSSCYKLITWSICYSNRMLTNTVRKVHFS
jgi:hypothetical protein